ncbi:MAG: DAK2 domain-containing protein, partial [Microbacteriaceae bacterium]
MDGKELIAAITGTLSLLVEHADELRDLDAALGDGDLGITVSSGSHAVIAALAALGDDVTPAEVAKASAKAFANANPSTMAALVAGALLAGSRSWASKTDISQEDGVEFGLAAADSISQRGKSQLGDKTILDAMIPAVEALKSAENEADALDAAIAAAQEGARSTQELQSRRGRAAWLQERSIGLQDPGAIAFVRFMESW